jgi:hypothetical protein
MMKVGAVSGAMWEGLNKNKRNKWKINL